MRMRVKCHRGVAGSVLSQGESPGKTITSSRPLCHAMMGRVLTPKKLGVCLVVLVPLLLLFINVPSRTRHDTGNNRERIASQISHGLRPVSEAPKVPVSHKLLSTVAEPVNKPSDEFSRCTFDVCFNLSRCPLNKPFAVYVYSSFVFPARRKVTLLNELVASLEMTDSHTTDPDAACVFVAVVWNSGEGGPVALQTNINSLAHWGQDGENHILIELSTDQSIASLLEGVHTGKAIVSRSYISSTKPFRTGFDILLPPVQTVNVDLKDLPPLLPVNRKNFIYFHGDFDTPRHQPDSSSVTPTNIRQAIKGKDRVDIAIKCTWSRPQVPPGVNKQQWRLCGDQNFRLGLCSKSMFSLVPSPGGPHAGVGASVYTRLVESLMCGSIPVIIGVGPLPFDEVIDWSRAAISIPLGRLSDIYTILHSVSSDNIQNLRLHARNLWFNYFRSQLTVIQAAINIVRSRTFHPPPFAPDFSGQSLLSRMTSSNYIRIRSPLFSSNFTTYSSVYWNSVTGPRFSFPNSPFTPGPLTGSRFSDADETELSGLHSHTVRGKVVRGTTFARHLLGNHPDEQFTVILLTYKRNKELVGVLEKLKNVPFLNKVIVVWNNEEEPPTMIWPNIGVPLEVVRGKGNSLNNRFLPFKEIETEAVLSIDDDAVSLTPDEIQFGFRAWREARDQLVGFTGRSHSYDINRDSWIYNKDYDCEVSIVLTSVAFFHKAYLYLYSYWMPQEVRDMVDKYMNCEDISMQALISHITRKPPLKVTRLHFIPCPTCPQHLSTNNDHIEERHNCLNILASIYGYLPLLYTQYRGDSMLYEASTSNRCFDYV